MADELTMKNWREYVGRFSVECEVANQKDVHLAEEGFLPTDQVRRTRLSGLVDTGATRLVPPATVATALGLPEWGQVAVRYSDGRRETRAIVRDVRLEIQGRSSVFKAGVEPESTEALIGAIVLEELDFVPDCTRQVLQPCDPNGLFAEIE